MEDFGVGSSPFSVRLRKEVNFNVEDVVVSYIVDNVFTVVCSLACFASRVGVVQVHRHRSSGWRAHTPMLYKHCRITRQCSTVLNTVSATKIILCIYMYILTCMLPALVT